MSILLENFQQVLWDWHKWVDILSKNGYEIGCGYHGALQRNLGILEYLKLWENVKFKS